MILYLQSAGAESSGAFLLPVMILAMVLRCRLDLTYFDEGTCAHMGAVKILSQIDLAVIGPVLF